MATSSKVKFDLKTLTTQALETLEAKIQMAEAQVASHTDDKAFAEVLRVWRETQEGKVRFLVEQLDAGQVDDYRLSQFRIEDLPQQGSQWRVRDDQRRLDDLRARRGEITAKAASLVPDEDGSISLTKTQLREFFGL